MAQLNNDDHQHLAVLTWLDYCSVFSVFNLIFQVTDFNFSIHANNASA